MVLLGRDAPILEQVLSGCAPLLRVQSLEDAVTQARSLAQPGDIVLLSPACASLDMFKNFEERGQRFAAAVEALS